MKHNNSDTKQVCDVHIDVKKIFAEIQILKYLFRSNLISNSFIDES